MLRGRSENISLTTTLTLVVPYHRLPNTFPTMQPTLPPTSPPSPSNNAISSDDTCTSIQLGRLTTFHEHSTTFNDLPFDYHAIDSSASRQEIVPCLAIKVLALCRSEHLL